MQALRRIGIVLALVAVAGCELVGETEAPVDYGALEAISYARHVQPLLNAKCTACHAGADAAAGLRLDGWDHLIAGSRYGEAVIPFDAARSRLLEMATKRVGGAHPREAGGDTLTHAEVAFLRRWIDEGARNDRGAVPYAGTRDRIYVCNQDAALISVIDAEANLVVRTVDLQAHGFSATAKPHHVVVEPDGSYWYVSLIGENKIARFDRENRLVGTVDFPAPGLLALDPARDRLYAGHTLSIVDVPATLAVIRRSEMRLVEVVDVLFPRPHALALDPTGAYLYSASVSENRFAAIEAEGLTAGLPAALGTTPQAFVQFAASPDGRRLYLTGSLAGQVHLLDLTRPDRPTRVQTLEVGAQPWVPVFTRDGRHVFVGNKGAHTVTVIDAEAGAVVEVIEGHGLAQPHGAAVSPDGRFIYISNNNRDGHYTPRHDFGDNARIGTVVVLDRATRAIVRVLEVETYPTGLNAP